MCYAGSSHSNTGWTNGTADHVVGECKYDFIADKEDELSVAQGQRINLAPSGRVPSIIIYVKPTIRTWESACFLGPIRVLSSEKFKESESGSKLGRSQHKKTTMWSNICCDRSQAF